MTHKNENDFERALHALRDDEPSAQELRQAGSRVWQRLQGAKQQPELIQGCDDVRRLLPAYSAGELAPERELLIAAHLRECLTCRQRAEGRAPAVDWTPAVPRPARIGWPRFALAAAMVALVALSTLLVYNFYFAVPAGARATVHALDGVAFRVADEGERQLSVGDTISEGELVRTAAGGHTVVKLSDGSLVEVNERSEFALNARGRDMTIALDRGAVIVEAAKRSSGHLYVRTPDCRVAVTGTVFSVTSGVKGSRVSVVEGAVRVKHMGETNELAAGQQLTTSDNLAEVPVAEDIAWSRDLDKHLQMLASLGQLRRQLEQVQLPGPRYSSQLLGRMPADAIFYASLPNAGQALEEAHRILQTQIEQSPALREWWGGGNTDAQARMEETIRKLRQLSDYLGEEVVIVGFAGKDEGMAIVAEVRNRGLREFLASQFSTGDQKLVVISDAQAATVPQESRFPVALVRENEVVFSVNGGALQRVLRGLNGAGGLAETDFGRRIGEAYNRGTGFLLAADLHRITANEARANRNAKRRARRGGPSGFENVRYLMAEHREPSGKAENRLVVDFDGPRRGIASWLATPAPMGSLEFVSRNAALAVAFVAKDPKLMLTDMLAIASADDRDRRKLAEMESKLNIRMREDLAAHFGGDALIALDGPVVPTPSWKLVVEVNHPAALADSLTRVVQAMDAEAKRHGRAGFELHTEDVSGHRFYEVRERGTSSDGTHYTFAAGYMIVGPTRAVLMNTIRTRVTGDSLARSGNFKALLPSDRNTNYSAIAYQNLAPILQPLLEQVSGETANAVRQLAVDSRPTVVVARGAENRIEAVSTSRLTAFDWFALARLLEAGTSKRQSR